MQDRYEDLATTLISPAAAGAAIAPGEDAPHVSRALYVGRGGDLTLRLASGDEVTLRAVPAGSLLPLRVARVIAASGGAGQLVLLW